MKNNRAMSKKQPPTSTVIGHCARSHLNGELVGIVPLELVSQVEATLTTRPTTTTVPRKAAIFHTTLQSRIHKGAETKGLFREGDSGCAMKTLHSYIDLS